MYYVPNSMAKFTHTEKRNNWKEENPEWTSSPWLVSMIEFQIVGYFVGTACTFVISPALSQDLHHACMDAACWL